jgi:hypothetical protein
MIHPKQLIRALGLALALGGFPAPDASAQVPPERSLLSQPALATRRGDPASWSTFEQCLEYLERWAGRQLPDWVVHTAVIRYDTRRPLYGPAGDPLLDAAGRQACATAPATGRVFFPPAWRLPRKPKLPLVVYTHATMMEKTHAPSEFGGHEWMLGAAAAMYYGYAVAMPDQPGMGGDAQDYHPFCHAKSLAYSTLDALPAVERLAREDPYLAQRGYGWDRRFYLMGYSEGGYTSLAAVKELEAHPADYAEPFTFTGAACMAGPFDLSGTTRDEIVDPVTPFAHSFYLPFVITAYQRIYGDRIVDAASAFAPVLLEPRADGNLLEWADGSLDGLSVDDLIGRRLGVPGDAVVLRRMLNPDWLARELDDPAYATSTIRKILEENDLCRSWRPTHPILFCQSRADRDVQIQNTLNTLSSLGGEIRKAGGDPDQLLAFLPLGRPQDQITHVEGAMLAVPAAFNWFYYDMPMGVGPE